MKIVESSYEHRYWPQKNIAASNDDHSCIYLKLLPLLLFGFITVGGSDGIKTYLSPAGAVVSYIAT